NRRKIFLPYLMLKVINDTPEHCQALKQLILKRKNPYLYHVNLVQYHPSPLLGKTFQPSNRGTVSWFVDKLEKARIGVTVRQSFGENISAACGQLYAQYQKDHSCD
ncbi:MAG: 23S rRNA (adenine(2503)-C(8))-methyltransferase ClbB, partial [Patescibacteria group bacterium]